MNDLDADCGAHCGTDERGTHHCHHCHEWALYESDGCGTGWDGSTWYERSEDHEPGSHELRDLAAKLATRTASLTWGQPSNA